MIGLLCISFLRIDPAAFRAYLQHPGIVICATVWTSFIIPLVFALIGWTFSLEVAIPALFLGLMLQAVASPLMAAPAFAALMGLDATLVLTTLIASTALVPLTVPLFAWMFDLELSVSPLSLGVKLFAIVAGSAVIGLLLRFVVGPESVERRQDEIDGLNILFLFVFVSAVMGGAGVRFIAEPLQMIGLLVLAIAIFAALLGTTCVAFRATGVKRSFALGMMSSQRNLGLMLAGTGGVLPEVTWMHFAVSPIPIYLSPLLLKPIAGRIEQGSTLTRQ